MVRFVTQLIVEESAEKLDIALLTVDRQGFRVSGALLVVVLNRLYMGLEHSKEDEK